MHGDVPDNEFRRDTGIITRFPVVVLTSATNIDDEH
jgi:hypothetical protein